MKKFLIAMLVLVGVAVSVFAENPRQQRDALYQYLTRIDAPVSRSTEYVERVVDGSVAEDAEFIAMLAQIDECLDLSCVYVNGVETPARWIFRNLTLSADDAYTGTLMRFGACEVVFGERCSVLPGRNTPTDTPLIGTFAAGSPARIIVDGANFEPRTDPNTVMIEAGRNGYSVVDLNKGNILGVVSLWDASSTDRKYWVESMEVVGFKFNLCASNFKQSICPSQAHPYIVRMQGKINSSYTHPMFGNNLGHDVTFEFFEGTQEDGMVLVEASPLEGFTDADIAHIKFVPNEEISDQWEVYRDSSNPKLARIRKKAALVDPVHNSDELQAWIDAGSNDGTAEINVHVADNAIFDKDIRLDNGLTLSLYGGKNVVWGDKYVVEFVVGSDSWVHLWDMETSAEEMCLLNFTVQHQGGVTIHNCIFNNMNCNPWNNNGRISLQNVQVIAHPWMDREFISNHGTFCLESGNINITSAMPDIHGIINRKGGNVTLKASKVHFDLLINEDANPVGVLNDDISVSGKVRTVVPSDESVVSQTVMNGSNGTVMTKDIFDSITFECSKNLYELDDQWEVVWDEEQKAAVARRKEALPGVIRNSDDLDAWINAIRQGKVSAKPGDKLRLRVDNDAVFERDMNFDSDMSLTLFGGHSMVFHLMRIVNGADITLDNIVTGFDTHSGNIWVDGENGKSQLTVYYSNLNNSANHGIINCLNGGVVQIYGSNVINKADSDDTILAIGNSFVHIVNSHTGGIVCESGTTLLAENNTGMIEYVKLFDNSTGDLYSYFNNLYVAEDAKCVIRYIKEGNVTLKGELTINGYVYYTHIDVQGGVIRFKPDEFDSPRLINVEVRASLADNGIHTVVTGSEEYVMTEADMSRFVFKVVDEDGQTVPSSKRLSVRYDAQLKAAVLRKLSLKEWLENPDDYGTPEEPATSEIDEDTELDTSDIGDDNDDRDLYRWLVGLDKNNGRRATEDGVDSDRLHVLTLPSYDVNVRRNANLRITGVNLNSQGGCIYVYGTLEIDINVYIYGFTKFIHVMPGGKVIIRRTHVDINIIRFIVNDGGTVVIYGGEIYGEIHNNDGGRTDIYHPGFESRPGWSNGMDYTHIHGVIRGNGGDTHIHGGTYIHNTPGSGCIHSSGGEVHIYQDVRWDDRSDDYGHIHTAGPVWLPGGGHHPIVRYEGEDAVIYLDGSLTSTLRIIWLLQIKVHVHIVIIGTPGVYELNKADFDFIEAMLPDGWTLHWDAERKAVTVIENSATMLPDTDSGTDVMLYDVYGRQVDPANARPGIYIRKEGNRTTKIMLP